MVGRPPAAVTTREQESHVAAEDVTEEELSEEACWTLLAGAEVGRLAVATLNVPDVFPVNHVVDDRTIVFRTGPGTKLDSALSAPAVAFEVDGHDRDRGQAWSVVATGVAREISSGDAALLADALPLVSWHGGYKLRWIRITPRQVTGRRFRIASPAGS
jgi:uncharacterized protein